MTEATKKADVELYDLCYNNELDHTEETWNGIRQWVRHHKDEKGFVKQATEIRGLYNRTPLHWVLRERPPMDVVELLLNSAPETLRMKDDHGWLPLHLACFKGASLEVVKLLIEDYPESTMVRDDAGWLPIHVACCHVSSLDVVQLLIQTFPEGLTVQDHSGWLPIHRACWGKVSIEALNILIQANQKSLEVLDIWHRKPSDVLKLNIFSLYDNNHFDSYTAGINDDITFCKLPLLHRVIKAGYSVQLVKLLVDTFPETCIQQDGNGMTPLHIASEYRQTPDYVEIVLTLVNANPMCCSVVDNFGRIPSQIFRKVASTKDSKGMLLLHHQAIESKTLTINSLQYIFTAYPESISMPDSHGLLPFHYACLNTASSVNVLMLLLQLYPECIREKDGQKPIWC
jgi:ankyrin repeat protein